MSSPVRSFRDLPGPSSWPLIGNFHQVDAPRLHLTLERWSDQHGPYFRFRNRWRAQRKVVMADFDTRHLRSYFPFLARVTERFHRRWSKGAVRRATVPAAALLAASTASAVTCTASAGNIAFGNYNPLNTAALAATAPVTVQCSGIGVPIIVVSPVVSLSTGTSGSYVNRTLLFGTNTLSYNIYANVARSQILGNGTGGSTTLHLAPIDIVMIGSGQSSGTLYGYLPAMQNAAPGAYVDTITVTVSY